MKAIRSTLLIASALVMLALLGGGFFARVGAAESPYRQAVLFAEILGQVLDNYVDPVDTDRLVEGALEGMLAGLDPNGAYLTPAEVEAWKKEREPGLAGPGFSVLRAGRMLQVVDVEPASPAEEAGVLVGDQVRSVDGILVRDLSLDQARRLLEGEPGTGVKVEVLHPGDAYRRDEFDLVRRAPRGRGYALSVEEGVAVLRIERLSGIRLEELVGELDDVRSRGVERLLIDLRSVTDGAEEEAARLAGLFLGSAHLRLRDRAGRLVESVDVPDRPRAWPGPVAVLVNGATAGGAEGMALLLQIHGQAHLYGEKTYGLGARTRLYELDNGAGLLVSAALWETDGGQSWNGEGVAPDDVVQGEGRDHAEISADQFRRVLELVRQAGGEPEAVREAA